MMNMSLIALNVPSNSTTNNIQDVTFCQQSFSNFVMWAE